jgi:hypothetical protein
MPLSTLHLVSFSIVKDILELEMKTLNFLKLNLGLPV